MKTTPSLLILKLLSEHTVRRIFSKSGIASMPASPTFFAIPKINLLPLFLLANEFFKLGMSLISGITLCLTNLKSTPEMTASKTVYHASCNSKFSADSSSVVI